MEIKDITRITKLIGAYMDKTLSHAEREELAHWLRESSFHFVLFRKFTNKSFVARKYRFDECLDVMAAANRVLWRRKKNLYLKVF